MVKKSPMKIIRRILRMSDFFGESFTFRYKDEDKLSSILGGIICIVFLIITIVYFFYNLIPFAKKENFSLQYYTMNLNNSKGVKLSESPTAFAFGFSEENLKKNEPYHIFDLLNLKVEFSVKIKNEKNTTDIVTHKCKIEDFHNLNVKTFYDSKIEDFNCLPRESLLNDRPEGIYTDEIFSYYTIIAESKHPDNITHNKLINDFLVKYDCKLQFYYTDIILNLDKVKDPFSSVINSMFIQLDPTLIQKRNIFFMNYNLIDDNLLIHIKRNKEKPKLKTGLSRIEDYSLYKGLNRTETLAHDRNFYAKLYIRIDNRKIEIKRKYQDFMEFCADTLSLLSTLFRILGFIFAYYDRIKANHSISKKLFFFEGTKYNNSKKFSELKKILNSAEFGEPINETKSSNTNNNKLNEINNIKINNQRPTVKIEDKKDEESSTIPYSRNPHDSKDVFTHTKSKLKKQAEKIENEENLINYSSYNIFEMLISFKICCKTKKFENKISLIQQAKNIIDDKLDIVFYIRNMILFELINKIYFEDMDIINFLSRPIIYFKKEEVKEDGFNLDNIDLVESLKISNSDEEPKTEVDKEENKEKKYLKKGQGELYKSAYKFDFYILSRRIKNLIKNTNKTKNESKLIKLLEDQLKGI